jgi:membrane-associated phospholipid phosphatase
VNPFFSFVLRNLSSPPTAFKSIWKTRYSFIHFRLVDLNCFAYFAIIGFLLPFLHHEVPLWPKDFVIHLLLLIGGLEIIRLGERYPHNQTLWTLRTFYPVPFYVYAWSEIDHLVRMFFGSYWTTDFLVQVDKIIFGVHPTVWAQQFYSPILDELMNFFFAGYYFFVPVVTLFFFLRGQKEETLAVLAIVTFTYFTNYLLFHALPALGPQMLPQLEKMRTAHYSGYFIASFNRFVQASGTVRGGAFPSSHVSGALAWSLAAWRYNRKLGYVLIPIALGVAIATVYLGYHHAVDPITGLILGLVCYRMATAILKRRKEDPATPRAAG